MTIPMMEKMVQEVRVVATAVVVMTMMIEGKKVLIVRPWTIERFTPSRC
jgi:hypothetical protein